MTINMDMKWEEASLEERQAVCKCYNEYYNTEDEPLPFEQMDYGWTGDRWYTIKYTFGIKPFGA